MQLNAVGVASSNFSKTIEFYKLLGFKFPEYKEGEDHVETIPVEGSPKLMIDSKKLTKEMLGEDPMPGNTSYFAIQYDSPKELNEIAAKIKEAGFKIEKEPWDAFWGQRYCVVEDPDGYKADLYATL